MAPKFLIAGSKESVGGGRLLWSYTGFCNFSFKTSCCQQQSLGCRDCCPGSLQWLLCDQNQQGGICINVKRRRNCVAEGFNSGVWALPGRQHFWLMSKAGCWTNPTCYASFPPYPFIYSQSDLAFWRPVHTKMDTRLSEQGSVDFWASGTHRESRTSASTMTERASIFASNKAEEHF